MQTLVIKELKMLYALKMFPYNQFHSSAYALLDVSTQWADDVARFESSTKLKKKVNSEDNGGSSNPQIAKFMQTKNSCILTREMERFIKIFKLSEQFAPLNVFKMEKSGIFKSIFPCLNEHLTLLEMQFLPTTTA